MPKSHQHDQPHRPTAAPKRRPLPIIKGQDHTRWTDFYHPVLTASWPVFILGLGAVFLAINAVFAGLYLLAPADIANERPDSFWDAFYFSVQTFGSIGYGVLAPKTAYANTLVTVEAFTALVSAAIATGLVFARFSRPTARVLFSNVAVVTTFDGKPTLMFRAANQRGNQILDANVSVTLVREMVSKEGTAMRRFEELKLVRARSPLFALSWSIMHTIDETSPLFDLTQTDLIERQAELLVLLRGIDETLSETIFARRSYTPDRILWGRRFVDVLSMTEKGRRVVDLGRFHDTEADGPASL